MRGIILALALLWGSVSAHALDWTDLIDGMKVELTEPLITNTLNSGVTMMCRMSTHYVYPKIKISPIAAQGQGTVYARFFTVVGRRSDALTYEILLQSDQLPCACVVHVMQAPELWRGEGREFARLVQPDAKTMAKEKPVPAACVNNPSWLKPRPALSPDKQISI